MKIKYYFLLAVVVLSSAFTLNSMSIAPVKALEEPTQLTNVVLQIYPEYDDLMNLNTPSLLVRLQGRVDGVTLPATIRFLVPSTALMYSAGSFDASGKYVGGPPNRIPYDDLAGWDVISYDISNPIFIMEYYDPVIGNQPDKIINYEFHPLYPIADLQVAVQEPYKSSNFSVTPTADSTRNRADELSRKLFNFHQYNRSNLAAGDVLRYDITYTKSDLLPSLSTDAGSGSSDAGWIVGAIFGGLILVGVGVYFVLKIRSNNRRKKLRRTNRRAMAGVSKKKRLRDRFCGKCRQPLESSDVFCPNCGAKRNN